MILHLIYLTDTFSNNLAAVVFVSVNKQVNCLLEISFFFSFKNSLCCSEEENWK